MHRVAAYLPPDRAWALMHETPLPQRSDGSILFADLTGFTPLTAALAHEYGPRRGAETLSQILNLVYTALIAALAPLGGVGISFAGDAITCWFADDRGERAAAAGLAMHQALALVEPAVIAPQVAIALTLRVGVAAGPLHRFIVGDPAIQLIDIVAGSTLDAAVQAAAAALPGEVVLSEATALTSGVTIQHWRGEGASRGAVIADGVTIIGTSAVMIAPVPDAPLFQSWLPLPLRAWVGSEHDTLLADIRSVSTLFLRFVGLDYDRDPEACLRLNAFVRWVQQTVTPLGGMLLSIILGDKGSYLYITFGAPTALEHAVHHAVEAALQLCRPPAAVAPPAEVQIGLSTGQLWCGAYGSPQRWTYSVVGNAANLAARLMQLAAPGEILATADVQEQTCTMMEWTIPAPVHLKGQPEAWSVSRLIGRSATIGGVQIDSHHAIPLIGRAPDLDTLTRALEQTWRGAGQVMVVIGEPGIGKSRLAIELIGIALKRGLRVASGGGRSHRTQSPYLAWQSVWRSLLTLADHQPLNVQIQIIEAQLAAIEPQLLLRMPLLGPILGLPLPETDLTRSFDARFRKESTLDLLRTILQHMTARNPILIVIEDCHWLDELSRDLVQVISQLAWMDRLCVVLTTRPFRSDLDSALPQWMPPQAHLIHLTPLTHIAAHELVTLHLAQTAHTPLDAESLLRRLIARAQGNPLYLREFVTYLSTQKMTADGLSLLSDNDVPDHLERLILSRIDVLAPEQQVIVKVASVFGRHFEPAWIAAAFPAAGDVQAVTAALTTIQRANIVVASGEEYHFTHDLWHEVPYAALPATMRYQLHERFANAFESRLSTPSDTQIALLAYHYVRSQNTHKQRVYLPQAAAAARRAYAHETAIQAYRHVLPLLADTPAEQLPMLKGLAESLETMGQWDAARRAYEELLHVGRTLQDQIANTEALVNLAGMHRWQGRYEQARSVLVEAEMLARSTNTVHLLAMVLQMQGNVARDCGDYATAWAVYQECRNVTAQGNDRRRWANATHSLGIIARTRGDLAEAQQLLQEGLRLRRQISSPGAVIRSLIHLGSLALQMDDVALAETLLLESHALSTSIGDLYGRIGSLGGLGFVALAKAEQTGDDGRPALAWFLQSLRLGYVRQAIWSIAVSLIGVVAATSLIGGDQMQLVAAWSGTLEGLLQDHGIVVEPLQQDVLVRALARARGQLGQESFTMAWNAGKTALWNDVIKTILDRSIEAKY